MEPEQAKNSNLFVGVGLLLQIVGGFLTGHENAVFIGVLFTFAGSFCFIWGCCCFAKGKGYHPLMGLLGLLSLLGLIILVVLPDRKW